MNFNQFLTLIWLGYSRCTPRFVETKVFVRPSQGQTLFPANKALTYWEYLEMQKCTKPWIVYMDSRSCKQSHPLAESAVAKI